MKNQYKEPEFKIVKLNFEDICSVSLATHEGDNEVDPTHIVKDDGTVVKWWD